MALTRPHESSSLRYFNSFVDGYYRTCRGGVCNPLEVFSQISIAVREFVNKSAASAASPEYVKFQAVIKSAASAASLRGGRASGRLDHGLFVQFLAALAAKN